MNMADKPKFKIMPYKVNVRIRCIDDLPELKTKGYPVVFKGFRKYKFAVHRKIKYLEDNVSSLWVVTEMSSGIAFKGGFGTRLQAVEDAYLQLNNHKKKFIKKIQEFQLIKS